MTKSDLIVRIAQRQPQLSRRDVELAVNSLLEGMSQTLEDGGRIEIRGFGSFSLHYREACMGRNPSTGQQLSLPGRYTTRFKPAKALRDSVEANGRASSGLGGETNRGAKPTFSF